MPLVFPLLAILRKLWGRPPGLRGTPSSRIRNNGVSVLQGASRPTGASAAVQGDRPTIYAGAQHRKNEWHYGASPPNGAVPWRPLIRHADQRIGGLPCRDGTRVARWLGTARLPDHAVGSGGSSLIFRWYIESVYSYLIWCNPGCDPFWSNSTTLHTKP